MKENSTKECLILERRALKAAAGAGRVQERAASHLESICFFSLLGVVRKTQLLRLVRL